MELYVPSPEFPKASEKEKGLYSERAVFSVDDSIEKLKKLKNGEIEMIELPEKEMAEILSFENKLGMELEEIFKIKVNSAVIHPEYLLTIEGKNFFKSCAEFDVEGNNINSIEKFIYENRNRINELSGIQLRELEGQLKKYSEDELAKKISANMADSGELNIDGITTYQAINILLNPEEALDKLQKLRNFKRSLKELTIEAPEENKSENFKNVTSAIIGQYKKRVNEIIVEQFGHVVKAKLLADKTGKENLSKEEEGLLAQFSGLEKFVSAYSRFDKFIFGVENDVDDVGNYKQIGEKMEQYANQIENLYIENECSKKQKVAEKGLDFKKIMKKDISKNIFSKYAEAFLDEYGQKSSLLAEEFDPKRKGPAPDEKWQFVTGEKYNAMNVNLKQKVITAPTRDRSVQELVSVMLGHEFTHVVQALNQSKIKLKLYDLVGGDRRQVLAEGAAMSMQKQVSEEMFGFSELPKPNYVKAMSKKINGGSYLDCVKAYYECSLKTYLKTTEKIDQDLLKEKTEQLLKIAIRSCKRLFKSGEQIDLKTSILSKSKDTVYIEQLIVMDRLREAGLEKFALVRGLNLDSLFVLLQNGFIKEDDIKTLNMDFIRKTWEELKNDFILKNEDQNIYSLD